MEGLPQGLIAPARDANVHGVGGAEGIPFLNMMRTNQSSPMRSGSSCLPAPQKMKGVATRHESMVVASLRNQARHTTTSQGSQTAQ